MAPCASHGPLSVGGFLYCGCRSMSDETGRKYKVHICKKCSVFCLFHNLPSTFCWHNYDQQTFVIAMNKDDLPCLQLAVLSFCGDSL